ncbi:MAG: hypothetical protein A2687_01825 [Candidatus Levybacteria bacterium RIFCSPHIGHO2_01_FULL_38_26]|nr:MAG: hypothetical protein A2687_01825 [Candidatus Levybacteria bacterium RIFCSPHIGHO2_01_FULL_38_26]
MIFFLVVAYVALGFLAFGKLPFTFFQQDEWAIFGNYIYWEKASLGWWERLFIYEQDTHIIPFSNLFSFLQFKAFGLNFFYYGISSILLHIINAILVYVLSTIITNKKSVGYIAGAVFLISSVTHQAVTWVATSPGTLGATFFTILSLIFFFKFMQSNTKKVSGLLLVLLLLIASLFFKETSVFLFGLIPVLWLILGGARKEKHPKALFFVFCFFVTFYILFRLFILFFGYESTSDPQYISQPTDIAAYAFRIPTVPLKFIAQSIIPQSTLISIGNTLVEIAYPQFAQQGAPDPYISQTIAVDIISYLSSIIFLMFFFVVYRFHKRLKKEKLAKAILVSFVGIVLSSLPFVLIPGKAGYFSLIDGRHLYLSNVFLSIALSTVLYGLYRWIPKRQITIPVFILILMAIVIFNIRLIRRDLNVQVGNGIIRTSILHTISNTYPTLSSRVVFYTQADKSYYGLPEEEKILPFQSGFGQTLLVWYNSKGENFPSCFFKEKYLYVLLEEGYRECEGRGFGYFRKMNSLKKAVIEYGIPVESIVAFSYDSSSNKLTDISDRVRSLITK